MVRSRCDENGSEVEMGLLGGIEKKYGFLKILGVVVSIVENVGVCCESIFRVFRGS